MPEHSCAQLLRPWWNAWPAEGEQHHCRADVPGRQVMNRQISMLHELQGIGLNVFSHLSGATKLWADASNWADASIKMILFKC